MHLQELPVAPIPGNPNRKEYLMRIPKTPALFLCLFLSACAGAQVANAPPSGDYVEVDNPTMTMSKDAPAKIWVRRQAVEEGPLRGGEVLKRGADQLIENVLQPARK